MDQQQFAQSSALPSRLQYVIYEVTQVLEHLKATPDAELQLSTLGLNASNVKEWLQNNPREAKEIFADLIHPTVVIPQKFEPRKKISIRQGCLSLLEAAPDQAFSVRELSYDLTQKGIKVNSSSQIFLALYKLEKEGSVIKITEERKPWHASKSVKFQLKQQ